MAKLTEIQQELNNMLTEAEKLSYPAVHLFFTEFIRLIDTYQTARKKRDTLQMGNLVQSDELDAWQYLLNFVINERLKRFNKLNTENDPELNRLIERASEILLEIARALRREYLPTYPMVAEDLPADYKKLGNDLRKKVVYLRNRAWDLRKEKGNLPYLLAAAVLWVYDQRSFIMQDLSDDQATLGRDVYAGKSNDKCHYFYVYPLNNAYKPDTSSSFITNVAIHTCDIHFSNGKTPQLAAALKAFLAAPKQERTPDKHPVLGDLLAERPLGFVSYWEEAMRDNNETAFWSACQGTGYCIDLRLGYLYQNFPHTSNQKTLSGAQRDDVGIELQKVLMSFGDLYSTESYTKTMTALVANVENLNAKPELGDDFDINEIVGLNNPKEWCHLGAKGLDLILQDLYYQQDNGKDMSEDLAYFVHNVSSQYWKELNNSFFANKLFRWIKNKYLDNKFHTSIKLNTAFALLALMNKDSNLLLRFAAVINIFNNECVNINCYDKQILDLAKSTVMELVLQEFKNPIPLARGNLDRIFESISIHVLRECLSEYCRANFEFRGDATKQEIRAWFLFLHQLRRYPDGFENPIFKDELSDFRKCFNELLLAHNKKDGKLLTFIEQPQNQVLIEILRNEIVTPFAEPQDEPTLNLLKIWILLSLAIKQENSKELVSLMRKTTLEKMLELSKEVGMQLVDRLFDYYIGTLTINLSDSEKQAWLIFLVHYEKENRDLKSVVLQKKLGELLCGCKNLNILQKFLDNNNVEDELLDNILKGFLNESKVSNNGPAAVLRDQGIYLDLKITLRFRAVEEKLILEQCLSVLQRLNQWLIETGGKSAQLESALYSVSSHSNLKERLMSVKISDQFILAKNIIQLFIKTDLGNDFPKVYSYTESLIKILETNKENKDFIKSVVGQRLPAGAFQPLRDAWNQDKALSECSKDVYKCYRRLGWWQRRRIKRDWNFQMAIQYTPQTELECMAVLKASWSEEAKEQAITRLLFQDWGKRTPTTIARLQKAWLRPEESQSMRIQILQSELMLEQKTWRFSFCRITRKHYTTEVYKAIRNCNDAQDLACRVIMLKSRLR